MFGRKEVFCMPTEIKRISFVVTPEIEASLDHMKQEFFYNRPHSHMIRELLSAGVRAVNGEKGMKEDQV